MGLYRLNLRSCWTNMHRKTSHRSKMIPWKISPQYYILSSTTIYCRSIPSRKGLLLARNCEPFYSLQWWALFFRAMVSPFIPHNGEPFYSTQWWALLFRAMVRPFFRAMGSSFIPRNSGLKPCSYSYHFSRKHVGCAQELLGPDGDPAESKY